MTVGLAVPAPRALGDMGCSRVELRSETRYDTPAATYVGLALHWRQVGNSAVALTLHAGEFGLDRAAVVMDVGVRGVMPGYQHQLALTKHHLRVAAEMHRAVSMHCVRCYGHLLELFRCAACLSPVPLRGETTIATVCDRSTLTPHNRWRSAETIVPNVIATAAASPAAHV